MKDLEKNIVEKEHQEYLEIVKKSIEENPDLAKKEKDLTIEDFKEEEI